MHVSSTKSFEEFKLYLLKLEVQTKRSCMDGELNLGAYR
jgi:hypothetical protein